MLQHGSQGWTESNGSFTKNPWIAIVQNIDRCDRNGGNTKSAFLVISKLIVYYM